MVGPLISTRRSGPKEPVLTVFAGPNGSGKSTLTSKLASQSRIGILLNADEIPARMASDAGLEAASADMQLQWIVF
ncbi:MAG: AAA family ATPase [Gammaproteobacteria bacterium]|nr:AAA family ATPase [Gammaproteobacteria bacterium]